MAGEVASAWMAPEPSVLMCFILELAQTWHLPQSPQEAVPEVDYNIGGQLSGDWSLIQYGYQRISN